MALVVSKIRACSSSVKAAFRKASFSQLRSEQLSHGAEPKSSLKYCASRQSRFSSSARFPNYVRMIHSIGSLSVSLSCL